MPLKKIQLEKKQEQHLFYTSLKYTKTGDLMVNVIKKMNETLEMTINAVLEKAKKKKLINGTIPKTPIEKISLMKKLFKKEKVLLDMLKFYEKMRNIDEYKKIAEGEFRKGVVLKIFINDEVLRLDVAKLTEIQKNFEETMKILENFLLQK